VVSIPRRAEILAGPRAHGEPAPSPSDPRDVSAAGTADTRPEEAPDRRPRYWAITLRGPDGRRYPPRHVREEISDPEAFRAPLVAIARIGAPEETDGGEGWIGDYELEVREPGHEHQDPDLTLRWLGTDLRTREC
jgi:hypothetical protein